jgi:hypothetical protein
VAAARHNGASIAIVSRAENRDASPVIAVPGTIHTADSVASHGTQNNLQIIVKSSCAYAHKRLKFFTFKFRYGVSPMRILRRLISLFNPFRDVFTEPLRYWALTESNGSKHFQFSQRLTESAALAYLRANFQGASVDYIDYDVAIIFYRLGR